MENVSPKGYGLNKMKNMERKKKKVVQLNSDYN